MRTALTRRTSAIALAGVLALAGAACGDDADDTGADVDVTEEETTAPAITESEMDTEMTTETETEMTTETETATE